MKMSSTGNERSALKKTVLATSGCRLLSAIEPVDRHAAEGHRRHSDTDVVSLDEARRLVDEERRRTTTDPLQKFVLDVKFLFRNGGFGLSQHEGVIQRLTNLTRTKVTDVDLSNIPLCDLLVDSLADYLASPSCIVVSLKSVVADRFPSWLIVVRSVFVKRLAQACGPKLRFFQASHVNLSTETLRSKRVLLPRTGCDNLDVTAAAAFLSAKKKPLVEVLDLSGNELTGPKDRCNLYGGIEILADAIAKCAKLTRLVLNHVNLRSDGLVHLALGLQYTTSIRHLELGGNAIQTNVSNQVCYNGVDAFCEALRVNHTIRHLALPQNDMDYTCASKLADILRVNDTLDSLDLSQNPLGSAAMCCVAKALHANVPLVDLNVSDTGLGDKGCVALADALVRNTTLRTLDLTKNPDVHELGCVHLVAALERNATLARVKLTTDGPPDESVRTLTQLAEANAALATIKKSLATFDFAALSPFAQVNFVNKLDACNDAELRALVANQSFVQCRLSDAQLSALQYYASLDMYTPLKRLVWAYDARDRSDAAAARTSKDDDDDEALWCDQPLVTLPPVTR
ncbi:Aste57867_19989 [Aphanomyces stellatus]|uniref:Aste57867_19989 protein n=1 Tax=Aphanomyces stellatus TaxID=120398 RepID=A0A485LE18_9STRA|nr:hypothetical protein As57867_019923 [Aphanomyces stellatus]VFT96686.1 Aste57867_19989 [Aphanomyces stellatus]